MAGQREDDEVTEVTFTRCIKCGVTVMTHSTPTRRLVHLGENEHAWQDWTTAAEAPPRPDHRTLSMWQDLRAALEHIRIAEFYLGFHPEKPGSLDWESVQMQLADARAVLGELANALADGARP